MKVSVIDLGFNSAKLVNYYVDYNNSYKAYQQEGAKVRLGQDLAQTGVLAQESMKRTYRHHEIISGHSGSSIYKACSSSCDKCCKRSNK